MTRHDLPDHHRTAVVMFAHYATIQARWSICALPLQEWARGGVDTVPVVGPGLKPTLIKGDTAVVDPGSTELEVGACYAFTKLGAKPHDAGAAIRLSPEPCGVSTALRPTLDKAG